MNTLIQRKSLLKRKRMHNFIFRFMIFGLILSGLFSCNRPDGVMSQSEMRAFLTDLHRLDGTLSVKFSGATEREKVYFYNALFQKHGITKSEFDSSLVYYTRNPKTFDRIYSGVIRDLNEINEDVKNNRYHPVLPDSSLLKPIIYNIWTGRTDYSFTGDSLRQKVSFVIKDNALLTKDIYELNFYLRIAKSDSSVNPYAVLRVHYADGHVDSIFCRNQQDSVRRKYKFRYRAMHNVKIDSLSGSILGSSKYKGKFNARVDSIRLMREYLPALQDSLRQHLDTVGLNKEKLVNQKIQKIVKRDVKSGQPVNPSGRRVLKPE
jgi:hypothetical protein